LLASLEAALGWEQLLNRRGTTWRQLTETERADLTREKALRLMLDRPALIKRPVLAAGDRVLIGFSPESYAKAL
jgi:arsenate reductase